MNLRLLDLFCGAGGAGAGYHLAGFEVVGVDSVRQPHYPFRVYGADALWFLDNIDLSDFDAIHASPPCQAYSSMYALPRAKRDAPRLIEPLRERLQRIGLPYIIENVPPAPLRDPITLCGSMFGLRCERGYLQRHRKFEIGNWERPVLVPDHFHNGKAVGVYGHGQAGHSDQRMRTATAAEARELLGIGWMNRDEMAQAIPPAYTRWLGSHLFAQLAPERVYA